MKRLTRPIVDLVQLILCFVIFVLAFIEDSQIGYVRAGFVFVFLGLLELMSWHEDARKTRAKVTNIHVSGPADPTLTGKAIADELRRYRQSRGRS